MNDKVEMCSLRTPYVCKDCGNELLFFVTQRGSLIDYKALFYNAQTFPELYKSLQYNRVRYMKCLVCDKEYIIDWSQHFPQQLTDRQALKKFGV